MNKVVVNVCKAGQVEGRTVIVTRANVSVNSDETSSEDLLGPVEYEDVEVGGMALPERPSVAPLGVKVDAAPEVAVEEANPVPPEDAALDTNEDAAEEATLEAADEAAEEAAKDAPEEAANDAALDAADENAIEPPVEKAEEYAEE